MNQEQHNQEREQIDRKFKGMFSTTKALKERGVAALDTSSPKSKRSRFVDTLYLVGGLLILGWLIFVIAYGLQEALTEVVVFLVFLPLIMIVAVISYIL